MVGNVGKKFDDAPRRLSFGDLVDKIFWLVITSSAGYVAIEMRGMGNSVQQLNEKVAVVITQISAWDKRIDGQDRRIEKLEDALRERRK